MTIHTPTPWKTMCFSMSPKVLEIRSEIGGPWIAEINLTGNHRENAAFIVRAVNCHDEMLETLKGLMTHPCIDQSKINKLDLVAIHNLIAEAEGGSK